MAAIPYEAEQLMAAITPIRPDTTQRQEERSRRLWLTVRRALLMICKAIEHEYGAEKG